MHPLPPKIPTPFSTLRCRNCGSGGSLIGCSAPGCTEYLTHVKCHHLCGGFLSLFINSGSGICLCPKHKLRLDRQFTDNQILYSMSHRLAGLKCVSDPLVAASIKDSGPDMRGLTVEVSVKVTGGGKEWFKGQVTRHRSKRQVLLQWENGDVAEWIDLDDEEFRFVQS
jgi:hypothetical protein